MSPEPMTPVDYARIAGIHTEHGNTLLARIYRLTEGQRLDVLAYLSGSDPVALDQAVTFAEGAPE